MTPEAVDPLHHRITAIPFDLRGFVVGSKPTYGGATAGSPRWFGLPGGDGPLLPFVISPAKIELEPPCSYFDSKNTVCRDERADTSVDRKLAPSKDNLWKDRDNRADEMILRSTSCQIFENRDRSVEEASGAALQADLSKNT